MLRAMKCLDNTTPALCCPLALEMHQAKSSASHPLGDAHSNAGPGS